MENYETIMENLLSFIFDIVNYENTNFLTLKYSTYDRFPEDLMSDINRINEASKFIQTSAQSKIKHNRLDELKTTLLANDIKILAPYAAGTTIRNVIIELIDQSQDVALGKINFIENHLKELDNLGLNPADPKKSFKAFFNTCNHRQFNYRGPDLLSINRLIITPNLIDELTEEVINRLEIIGKIKTGVTMAFSSSTPPPISLAVDKRIDAPFFRALDQQLLPGELNFELWYQINNSPSDQFGNSPAITEKTPSAENYFLATFLNQLGQSIISQLKEEYKNANVNRIKDMLYGLTELKCTQLGDFDPSNMASGTNKPKTKISSLVAALNKTFEKEKPLYNAVTISAGTTKNSNYNTEKQTINNMLQQKAL